MNLNISRVTRARSINLVALILGFSTLSACASDPNASSSPGDHAITIALSVDVTQLDPQLSGTPADLSVLKNLYDGLFNIAPDGIVDFALATDESISADGLTYTYQIRPNVTFHDGSALTAEDVAFSLNRAIGEETEAPYASDLSSIASVDALNDFEVAIHLSKVDPILRNKLAGQAAMIVPSDYFAEVGDKEFSQAPIGTGPFMFQSRATGQSIVLRKWNDYWSEEKPAIGSVTFQIAPEAATRLALLQTGEVDLATNLDASSIQALEDDEKVRTIGVASGSTQFLTLRETYPQFRNPLVSEALNYAIDRETIVKTLLKGLGETTGGIIPPDLPGFGAAVLEPFPYDPEKAKELLAQSGEKFDEPIPFQVPSGRWLNISETAQAIVADLDAVGVPLDLQMMDYGEWVDAYVDGTISPIFTDNLTARLRDILPAMPSSLTCESAYNMWCDPLFDQMVDDAAVKSDEDRVAAETELMHYLHDKPRSVFLWSIETVVGARSSLNWEPTPSSDAIDLRKASVD